MNQSRRDSLYVFLGIEIGFFLVLVTGVVMTFSPLWTPGGLFGWWNGYSSEEDVLGIVWLSSTVVSIFLGIVLSILAAAMGIWAGIGASIIGLATNRVRRVQAKQEAVADVADSAGGKGSMKS